MHYFELHFLSHRQVIHHTRHIVLPIHGHIYNVSFIPLYRKFLADSSLVQNLYILIISPNCPSTSQMIPRRIDRYLGITNHGVTVDWRWWIMILYYRNYYNICISTYIAYLLIIIFYCNRRFSTLYEIIMIKCTYLHNIFIFNCIVNIPFLLGYQQVPRTLGATSSDTFRIHSNLYALYIIFYAIIQRTEQTIYDVGTNVGLTQRYWKFAFTYLI